MNVCLAGHMYLCGERKSAEQLPLFLIVIATVVIPIFNVLIAYIYWTPIYPMFLCALLLTVDVFYHIALLNWYLGGIRRNADWSFPQYADEKQYSDQNNETNDSEAPCEGQDHSQQDHHNPSPSKSVESIKVSINHLERTANSTNSVTSPSCEIPLHFGRGSIIFENTMVEKKVNFD